jgi:hypothetical protein
MPCEKNTQVAGTLIPPEYRTLHSYQLAKEENEKNQGNNFLRRAIINNFFTSALRRCKQFFKLPC